MKISNVAGVLLVAAPCINAWGFLPDEPMLVKRSHTEALQDKLFVSLGPFQQKLDHDYTTVGPRDANAKYIKTLTEEEAKALEDWLNGLSHAHRRDEITKATVGVNSRITGRNYDGADEHRAVLHKYVDIIRGCPMFSSSPEEEISIPYGELDDNNWCQIAFGDVALKTKDTTGSLLSKFEELKQKLLRHVKAKRDRGFSFLDFGDPTPIEKREDFWTQLPEDPEKFNTTDDTEVKTIEKGRTFEKRDGSMLEAAEKGIEKSLASQLKHMVEDIEKDILFRFPYESDYRRKEAWEKFQEEKADLKHKYKLDKDSYSHDEKSVYKRDIWEDIEKMKKEFQDKLPLPFLGQDVGDKEEGVQKRDIWEEIEKMKQGFQDKLSLPFLGQDVDDKEEGVQKRDIWEEIEKMKQGFQDKLPLPFLGQDVGDKEEGVQKRDIWEEIEKTKQGFQDKLPLPFLGQDVDDKEEGVQKRDIWEEIEKMKQGFQDKLPLPFLGQDVGDKEEGVQKRDIWEEIEKTKQDFQDKLPLPFLGQDVDDKEEGVQKRDIWEEIEKMKQGFQDKLPLPFLGQDVDDKEEGVQKRDIWEEIEKMKQGFQDKLPLPFLGQDVDDKEKGVQKRDIWEDIEKMKEEFQDQWSFLDYDQDEKKEGVQKREPLGDIDNDKEGEKEVQEKGIFDELEKINQDLLDRLREKQEQAARKKEEAEKLKKQFLDQFNQAMEDSNMAVGALQRRDLWCPWCSEPVVEDKPRSEIDLPAKKDKAGDAAPSGWLWDEVRDGLINIGGKLEDVKHPSVVQNLSPARKAEPDEVGDEAPSGWL